MATLEPEDDVDESEIVFQLIERYHEQGLHLDGVPKSVRSNRDIIIGLVSSHGELLQHASNKLRGDREIVLDALSQSASRNIADDPNDCPEALQYASKQLRGDQEIVLEAVAGYGRMFNFYQNPLKWASKELRADPEFILKAQKILEDSIEMTGRLLDHSPDAADFLDGRIYWGQDLKGALAYASKELRADKDFMLKAIGRSKYGYNLFYASANLKNDRELVLEAIKKSAGALKYASKKLQGNREFLVSAVKINPSVVKHTSMDLDDDVKGITGSKIKILKRWPNFITKRNLRGFFDLTCFLGLLLIIIGLPIVFYFIGWEDAAFLMAPCSLFLFFSALSRLTKIANGGEYPGYYSACPFEETSYAEAVKIYYFIRSDEGRKYKELE